MNILITNDDGPGSLGTRLLYEEAKKKWQEAPTAVVTSDTHRCGAGMSLSCKVPGLGAMYSTKDPELQDHFTVEGATPADVIYQAFFYPELFFANQGRPDLVLVGVNYGHNVGLDVYHSGTAGAAMLAAVTFGATAWAFSQEVDGADIFKPPTETGAYQCTANYLGAFLRETPVSPGECFNVNFPKGPRSPGWKTCRVAPYSRWKLIPGAPPITERMENDIEFLKKGWITISELELRVNPSLRY